MFRKLYNRLILSHILPSLITLPLIGVALIYVLETRFLLPNLTRQMVGNAKLITQLASDRPDVWTNPSSAQMLVNSASSAINARLILLDPNGALIASSDPADNSLLNTVVSFPGLADAQKGISSQKAYFNQTLHENVVDVVVPVNGSDQGIVGIIRITHRYNTLYEEFLSTRYYIAGVLFFGLLAGAFIGFLLAMDIGVPIKQVTQSVYDLVHGEQGAQLPEKGPDEIKSLLRGVNTLVGRTQHLEEARRRLLANLVHEIGRPLGAMRPAIKALMKGAGKDPQFAADLLAGIDEQMDILERLLSDLAQFHEQVLGTMELDRQPTELSDWLCLTLRPWQEAAHAKRLVWAEDIPPDLPVVQIDPIRLGQVVGNLISNAIKFTPAGGRVSLSAGADEGRFWLRISDSGPGIPKEEQDKLFTPFFRGQQGRRFPQGMGLGLSIARDLTLAHGGNIELESKPGFGTTFTLWIPKDYESSVNQAETLVHLQK